MITRRHFTTGTALAAALGLTATACGSGGGGGGTPDGPVELRMTVWTADEGQLALFQEIADEYVQANPETVSGVTFETIPFEDYTTALTTQLSGGNPPDLAWNLGEAAGLLAVHCLEAGTTPHTTHASPQQVAELQALLEADGVELRWPDTVHGY